jgi:hypothetical protein
MVAQMTAPDVAALRQLAVRALRHRAGENPDATALSAATRRSFDELARVLAPLIGQTGLDALAARAVHLAQREYPWLAKARDPEPTDGPLADVAIALEQHEPALATEAAAAVLATFTGLLVTMIGEPLTVRLMRQAWPDAFADAGT